MNAIAKLLVNLSIPDSATRVAALPVDGVGLMRAEFIALGLGEHPRHLLDSGGEEQFIATFADALTRVARAFYPRPVTYRTLDLKSNEYRALTGGDQWEEQEENPMLGFRGCSRYLANGDEFRLELEAVRRVRASGLDNVKVMLPFVRQVEEIAALTEVMNDAGVGRAHGVPLVMMVEVPAAAMCAADFLPYVDEFSVGSNDLTQLLLAVDRDSSRLQHLFNESHPAVLDLIAHVVRTAHAAGKPVSLCGDGPSKSVDLGRRLLSLGLDALSVVPDAVPRTRELLQHGLR